MTYANLMVHLTLGATNEGLLRITRDLAARCNARVIGIVACQPMQIAYDDGLIYAEAIQEDRAGADADTKAAAAQFHAALGGKVADLDWQSSFGYALPADTLAQQARCADLLITGPDRSTSAWDRTRALDIGALLMRIGRPLLIVPDGATALNLDDVVIGWKDTRETRRAVADALPMLKLAGKIHVVEVAAQADLAAANGHLDDVVRWLGGHGITAQAQPVLSEGDDAARLEDVAAEHHAGLMVAGAYGHNRMTEWVLGGVTRDLLINPTRCVLISH